MAKMIVALVSLIVSIPLVILSGAVFSKLWDWFIVSTFELEPLSIPVAIGLSLMIHFTTHQTKLEKDDKDAEELAVDLVSMTLFSIFKSSMALFIGWTLTLFM